MRLLEVVAGPETRRRGGRRRSARSPTTGSARAWCAARTRPASSPTGSARSGCRRRSARRSRRPCRSRRPTSCWAARSASPRPASSASPTWSASTFCRTSPRACARRCRADDPFHEVDREFPLIAQADRDRLHRAQGQGRLLSPRPGSGGQRVKEAIDLATGAYHPAAKPRLEALDAAKDGGPRALFEADEPAARYAWRVMSRTLAYACSLVPEIADEITAVDEAMKRGYNWKWGPFELLDRIGPAWFAARLEGEGIAVPPLLRSRRATGSFYRVEDGRLQHLTPARRLRRRGAARGRAAARGRQAPQPAGREERLGQPVGHRRRRRLPRVPQQDERDRCRDAST